MTSIAEAAAEITRNPRFVELTRARARVRWGLSAIMVALFFGFVLMIGFARELLAMKVGNSMLPLGFYLSVGMLISMVALTGIYVYRASSLFGRLTDELVKELGL